jgi:DNA 3'-phosphatase
MNLICTLKISYLEFKMKSIVFAFFITLSISQMSVAQEFKRQTFLYDEFDKKDNKVKVAFFDADSTLRVSISGKVSANSATDVMILPDVEINIAELVKAGYLLAIVSNQGGIQAGAVTQANADAALLYTIEQIAKKNPHARIHYFDYAEKDDEFRKPNKGMGLRLEALLKARGLILDWKKSFMVGDSAYKRNVDKHPDGKPGTHFSNSDRLFAENLGIPFYEPTDYFGWRKHGINVFENITDVQRYLQNR